MDIKLTLMWIVLVILARVFVSFINFNEKSENENESNFSKLMTIINSVRLISILTLIVYASPLNTWASETIGYIWAIIASFIAILPLKFWKSMARNACHE